MEVENIRSEPAREPSEQSRQVLGVSPRHRRDAADVAYGHTLDRALKVRGTHGEDGDVVAYGRLGYRQLKDAPLYRPAVRRQHGLAAGDTHVNELHSPPSLSDRPTCSTGSLFGRRTRWMFLHSSRTGRPTLVPTLAPTPRRRGSMGSNESSVQSLVRGHHRPDRESALGPLPHPQRLGTMLFVGVEGSLDTSRDVG